jgi:UDP-2,3-diacylglucosamine pyrophosphatase LpxH
MEEGEYEEQRRHMMETFPKLERIRRLTLTPGMKLVCMSDMHRGDGSGADDFAQNSLIYRCALEHYLENGFTYVELGDAEELWENDNFDQIYITHTSVYELLAKFHDPDPAKTRYLKVWGNHDLYWKDNEAVYRTLFPDIEIYEGIVLEAKVRVGGGEVSGAILLLHGHQADPKCSGEAAAVSKFFVHHFWPDLQRCGVKDPTRAALNPGLCNEVDKRLHEWARNNDQGIAAIIAGHTHRAVFENLSLTERRYLESKVRADGVKIKHQCDGSYYNTGSCVHPLSITGIEITFENGPHLRLVKWGQATEGNALTIQRTVLEET